MKQIFLLGFFAGLAMAGGPVMTCEALAGTAAGALLALAAGWWGLREVLRRPVLDTLRRAGAV